MMSLSAKIITPFISLMILFALSTLYNARLLTDTLAQISMVNSSLSALPASFQEVRREAKELSSYLEKWREHTDDSIAQSLSIHLARLNVRLSEALIRLEAIKYPNEVNHSQRTARALHVTYVRLEAAITYMTFKRSEVVELLIEEWSEWSEALKTLCVELNTLVLEEELRQDQVEREALFSGVSFTLFSVLLGLILTAYIYRLLSPLKVLKEGVEALERGEYYHRVHLKGSDALVQLAQALNRMGEAIEYRDSQLETQQVARLHQARLATVGRLSAQITHELRNPLSSIGLNSELLGEELDELNVDHESIKSAQVLLKEIAREVERLKEITEEYLRFARLPRPEFNEVDLNGLCAEIIEFCKAECALVGIRLIFDPDPQPHSSLTDRNQVRSALLNLIRNAREALEMVEGDTYMILRVRSWGGEAKISVEDNGPGLSEEARSRLFEPFFSTKPQGTGLGLSMVKQIVEAQGGRIEIGEKEEASSSGAIFHLYLPLSS